MALDPFVDSVDDLPDDVAKEYTQGDDGKFYLQVTKRNGWELSDVRGLKTALSTERRRGRQLKQFEVDEDGTLMDPAEAKDAIAKVADMKDWDPEKQVAEKIKAREAALVKAHEKEKTALIEENQGLTGQLKTHLVTSEATKVIAGIAPDSVDLLLPLVTHRARMTKGDDGKFVARVMDENGNEAIGGSDGKPMTIAELVGEMADDPRYAAAFPGTGSTGAGLTGGGKKATERGGVRKVSASDKDAVQASIEDIAKGKVEVVD